MRCKDEQLELFFCLHFYCGNYDFIKYLKLTICEAWFRQDY